MLILIPAYEPDLRLVQLVRDLREAAPAASVLVVDDGSGPRFDGVFTVAAAAGAHLLRFPSNRGKGSALKSGFAWAAEHRPGTAVVCADCDGQHTPADIIRVAAAVRPGTIVLGGRRFTGRVPVRSRFGNTVTRQVFRLATGLSIHDTQTGLRGYPAEAVPWLLRVPGERFEYESTLLLEARAGGFELLEIPIETIYLDANAGSHFRPFRDSARIYAPLLRYGAASLAGGVLDWVGVLTLTAATGSLVFAVVAARVVSATVNFRLNRDFVFADRGDPVAALRRYALLAAGVLGANYTLLALLVDLGAVPLAPAKLLVETALFLAGFAIQRRSVFRTPATAPTPPAGGGGGPSHPPLAVRTATAP